MNGMMNCIFNKHMRFEINEHYNPKHLELMKKLERPLPELDESDALFDDKIARRLIELSNENHQLKEQAESIDELFDEDLMLKILDQERMLDDDM